jgi:hypothetical protein
MNHKTRGLIGIVGGMAVADLPGLISIIIIASLSVGCSNDLSRSAAENQLNTKFGGEREYEYIHTGHNDIGGAVEYVRVKSGLARHDMPDVFALADSGFLTVETIAAGVPMQSLFYSGLVDHIVIKPTDKASPFLRGVYANGNSQCNDACIVFITATPTIRVTGVTDPAEIGGRRASIVTYQLNWSNTPVGDLLHKQYSTAERRAAFVKYDDGWRLERE